jgi:transposase-like protein
MVFILCPKCHENIQIIVGRPRGRKAHPMPCPSIIDALAVHSTVKAAAESLGVSRGYIYHTLKAIGIDPKSLLKREVNQNGNDGTKRG